MKKIKTIALMLMAGIALMSCENQNEDVVKAPSKDGSIETVITVTHEKDFDLLTTTHKVWVKGSLDKSIVKLDTLKNLGSTTQEAEDSDGNTKTVARNLPVWESASQIT